MNEEKADHPISDTMAAEVLMDYYEIPEKRPTFREQKERKTSYAKFNLDDKTVIQDGRLSPLIYSSNQLRKRKIQNHINDFIGYNTMHGFHFTFDREHRFRRFIWICLIAFSIGLVSQKLYESIHTYMSYPFTTTSTVNYVKELQFPAISICNVNDLRISKMRRTLLHKLLQSPVKKGKRTSEEISGELYAKTVSEANHRLSDMLYKCEILGKACSYTDFKPFFQTQAEKCYTYYSEENKINQTGTRESFELVLNIEHYEYYNDALDAGIRLIIHDPNETPVRMQGVTLAPGMTSYVQIKQSKKLNLEPPFKTKCGRPELKYFDHYSENTCWLERLTDYVVSKCHCKDGFMPGGTRVCSLMELENCTWPEWDKFKLIRDINCPIACEEIDYESYLSFAMFPSNKYTDRVANEMNLTGSIQENRKFIRDNFLRVVMYYKHLSYIQMEQQPSYDFKILLGDIGGQLGLFLGTSILTVVEFFDLIAMVIYTRYFEIFKAKENGRLSS